MGFPHPLRHPPPRLRDQVLRQGLFLCARRLRKLPAVPRALLVSPSVSNKWKSSSLSIGPSLAIASRWMCAATANESVHRLARLIAEMLESKLASVPTCLRSRPSQALPSLWCNVLSASLMLPRTQRHPKSEVALRDCPWNTHDDSSRIRTVTRSDCSSLGVRFDKVALLVKQGNPIATVVSSPRSSYTGFRVVFLAGVSGLVQRYSSQWPDAPDEERTSSVGVRAPSN